MSQDRSLPTVTIIVPVRPGQDRIPALAAAAQLDYPCEKMEWIVAFGRQPAVQRNAAIRQAQGEVIYFLDDDACPEPGLLRRGVRHFEQSQVAMAGGPNLCPAGAPWKEKVFSVVLSSWLAFGPSRARYQPVGLQRSSGEKELILCNLLARRADLLEAGGFDESLYPNEENALMDQLQGMGRMLLYDPRLVVYRRPRATLKAFARMLFTYGRGRAEQFRRHPTGGSALNFVPPVFLVYLAVGPWMGWVGCLPLFLYVLALAGQALASSLAHGPGKSLAALPLVFGTHLLYGAGFWRGLFTKMNPAQQASFAETNPVTLETRKHLGTTL